MGVQTFAPHSERIKKPFTRPFSCCQCPAISAIVKITEIHRAEFFDTLRLPGKTRISLAARYWSLPGTYSHAQLQKVGGYIGKFL
jgi:hypothetical protein